jgi:hypothetical protein
MSGSKVLLVSLVSFFYAFSTPLVYAAEFEVIGNGDQSSNTVAVSQESSSSVTQSNTGTVDNAISTNANTGTNTISSSSGPSTIDTGSASQTVSTSTEQNTNGIVASTCCSTTPSTATVSGNGSDSTNTVLASSIATTSVSQTNSATISTIITGTANTGHNTITENGGSAYISTGDIFVSSVISNGPVNSSFYEGGISSQSRETLLSISNNGAKSTNSISYAVSTPHSITVVNTAVVNNVVNWDLSTGFNTIDGNEGSATIHTGSIVANIAIINDPINSSFVHDTCDCIVTDPGTGGHEDPEDSDDPGDSDHTDTDSDDHEDESSDSDDSSPDILGLSYTGLYTSLSSPLIFFVCVLSLFLGQYFIHWSKE